jgi:hypothetical protein
VAALRVVPYLLPVTLLAVSSAVFAGLSLFLLPEQRRTQGLHFANRSLRAAERMALGR